MISHLRSTAYGWLMLAGIFVSIFFWSRVAKRDNRLVLIYIAALTGAFFGAKLVYVGAEGWLHWHDEHRWLILATGKSITGALLGGYVAVEIAKRLTHYKQATGDWFAIIAPLSIMLGRIGCMIHGCCLGIHCEQSWYTMTDANGTPRWPSPLVELMFNAVMFLTALLLRWRRIASGQLFHIYLMAYGTFRFFHEFLRDTPRIVGPLSGYQVAAVAIAILGAVGFWKRRKKYADIAAPTAPIFHRQEPA